MLHPFGESPLPASRRDRATFTAVGLPAKATMLPGVERGSVTEGDHVLDGLPRACALGIAKPILYLARAHVAAYKVDRARSGSFVIPAG
jgi:hypothetical protein